jgi:hypothetical protein
MQCAVACRDAASFSQQQVDHHNIIAPISAGVIDAGPCPEGSQGAYSRGRQHGDVPSKHATGAVHTRPISNAYGGHPHRLKAIEHIRVDYADMLIRLLFRVLLKCSVMLIWFRPRTPTG